MLVEPYKETSKLSAHTELFSMLTAWSCLEIQSSAVVSTPFLHRETQTKKTLSLKGANLLKRTQNY